MTVKSILITSGPTRAPLDAVRYLSNRSTGRFGTLVANEALRRGALVTLIYGIGSETPPKHHRLRLLPVETNRDLKRALRTQLRTRRFDAVIHAMAVLDFQPAGLRHGKVGSRSGRWTVPLEKAPKIIPHIKRWAPRTFLVGFKLEVGLGERRLLARARRLLKESRADVVVANQFSEGEDREHPGYLMNATGQVVKKAIGKRPLARAIVALVLRQTRT
jgi:phosphopantothenoylcysteine synthetase/decarboxylase